jgi:hypothetical protein
VRLFLLPLPLQRSCFSPRSLFTGRASGGRPSPVAEKVTHRKRISLNATRRSRTTALPLTASREGDHSWSPECHASLKIIASRNHSAVRLVPRSFKGGMTALPCACSSDMWRACALRFLRLLLPPTTASTASTRCLFRGDGVDRFARDIQHRDSED